jgi:hypothetical protein
MKCGELLENSSQGSILSACGVQRVAMNVGSNDRPRSGINYTHPSFSDCLAKAHH